MYLDTTTRKLQVLLAGAATTNNHDVVVYYDEYVVGSNPLPGAQVSSSSGVTAVDILAAPAASKQRRLKSLTISNRDTVTSVVTVRYNDNAVTYDMAKATLLSGESLLFNDSRGWHVSVVGSVGRYLRTVLLTAGTVYTTGDGTNTILARLQAGGGGGGGAARAANNPGAGGGGSAGGYAEKRFTVTPFMQYTVAIGAGGAGGASGANNGTAGGVTTLAVGGTTVTANGGLGGIGGASGNTVAATLGGASPAVSTNGDLNCGGAPGHCGQRNDASTATGGAGGSCNYGPGGNATTTDAAGNNASIGFGGGGGGAYANAASRAGGNGAAGCIEIDEFS